MFFTVNRPKDERSLLSKIILFQEGLVNKNHHKTTSIVPLMLLLCCSYVALIPEKRETGIINGFVIEPQPRKKSIMPILALAHQT
jgi:hypothetical protein